MEEQSGGAEVKGRQRSALRHEAHRSVNFSSWPLFAPKM